MGGGEESNQNISVRNPQRKQDGITAIRSVSERTTGGREKKITTISRSKQKARN